MSYKGMGSTATDIAAVASAAGTAAAQIIAAASGGGAATTPYAANATIDPATGMPYGTINPATGQPYGTPALPPETSYTVPLVIGGLAVIGIGGYLFMKRGAVRANRRRVRRNRRRARRS